MKATAPKELWSGVFAAVGDLAEGSAARFTAGPDGLRLAALDVSNVLFAEARLPPHVFSNYEAGAEETHALDLGKLKNYVAAGAKGGEWEVSTAQDERGPLLLLKNGSLSFTTRPAPSESARDLQAANIKFQATLEARAEALRGLLRTLKKAKKEAALLSLRIGESAATLRVLNEDIEPLADLSLGSGEAMVRGEGETWLSADLLTPALSRLLALRPAELRAEWAQRGPARFTALLEAGGEVSVLLANRQPPEEAGAAQEEPPEEPEGETAETEPDDLPPDDPREVHGCEEEEEEAHAAEAAQEIAPLVRALSLLALPRPPAPPPGPAEPKRCGRCRLPDSVWTPVGPSGLCDFCASLEGPGGAKPYAAESRSDHRPGVRVRSSEEAARVARPLLREPGREQFIGLYLAASGEVIHTELLALGTLDAVVLHPREVFRPAILHGAAHVVLAHNHPSGDPTPSPEDREITRKLQEAGKVLGIELLDHVVLGDGFCSLRAEGP